MASFSQFGNDLHTGKRSFDIVGRRKTWYLVAVVSLFVAIVVPQLRGGFVFGIEFTGGSEFKISQVADQDQGAAADAVTEVVPLATPRVSSVSTTGIRVQTDQLTSDETREIRAALADAYAVPIEQVTASFIGPVWGQDITGQAVRGLLIFLVLAAIGMALYFRTWKMSVAAMTALMHDLVITAGIYGITGFEITPAAVIGFLTILGYSLYDTVVVFDKIRENTSEAGAETRTLAESVNLAVNQTLVRSINTSVVAVLPVASILFIGTLVLGAGTLRDISLALLIGIVAGAYSTIFIASPLYAQIRSAEPTVRRADQKVLAQRAKAGPALKVAAEVST
ncbi:protein translocase subunit SecF [Cryobacterium sp. TMT1-19]|uniref:protein translocase subunit SecF n=1 Tax=Cryobacterium sp. TMT1-19 TaxID=1259231 RepID=UPI00106D71BE|nr:protein translocase subunit SecF [Cryobacterium sp. TMT1-19]TFD38754.1 protein translocase subunit SecF [Cryobacterium sp. TMT1-19]